MAEPSPAYVEQYLLFDPTEFIKDIGHIGALSTIELVYYEEPQDVSELLELSPTDPDNLPRLF